MERKQIVSFSLERIIDPFKFEREALKIALKINEIALKKGGEKKSFRNSLFHFLLA